MPPPSSPPSDPPSGRHTAAKRKGRTGTARSTPDVPAGFAPPSGRHTAAKRKSPDVPPVSAPPSGRRRPAAKRTSAPVQSTPDVPPVSATPEGRRPAAKRRAAQSTPDVPAGSAPPEGRRPAAKRRGTPEAEDAELEQLLARLAVANPFGRAAHRPAAAASAAPAARTFEDIAKSAVIRAAADYDSAAARRRARDRIRNKIVTRKKKLAQANSRYQKTHREKVNAADRARRARPEYLAKIATRKAERKAEREAKRAARPSRPRKPTTPTRYVFVIGERGYGAYHASRCPLTRGLACTCTPRDTAPPESPVEADLASPPPGLHARRCRVHRGDRCSCRHSHTPICPATRGGSCTCPKPPRRVG